MNIDKIVNAVKLGVAEAGGVPVVFPAIAVCDGIAMGHVGMKYSLVTRDLIADSTECMAIAHQFDALVMVPNCDKNVPGLLMAASAKASRVLPLTSVSSTASLGTTFTILPWSGSDEPSRNPHPGRSHGSVPVPVTPGLLPIRR